MIGVRVSGPVEGLTAEIENIEGVEYLASLWVRFELPARGCGRRRHRTALHHQPVRRSPLVVNTETFVYLDLVKQNYEWGAH